MIIVNIIYRIIPILLACFLFVDDATAAAQPVFGPVKYEVKERYGRENRYRVNVPASGGSYIIKLQNGERFTERTDLLEFTLNRTMLLQLRHYGYPYLACFVQLQQENELELMIRDFDPAAFKRPALPPRNVLLTVLPGDGKLTSIVLGALSWDGVLAYADTIVRIRSAESSALARGAAGLQNENETRARAMRQLAERRDGDAREFLLHVFQDQDDRAEVRSEAALALGMLRDRQAIPFLFQGLLDPVEKIRMASAQALSRYEEGDTRELLSQLLHEMDALMGSAVMRTISRAGWIPVGNLLELGDSADADVANMSIELLIGCRDKRIVDRMIVLLQDPGQRDRRRVIAVLRESGDPRAIEPLTRMAVDPAVRNGMELDLAMALAVLGDSGSADLVGQLINLVDSRHPAYNRLIVAYKRMIGME